jgi:ABC-2 type transport system ATP-binding protein
MEKKRSKTSPVLELQDLHVNYNDLKAVNNVSLSVNKGQMYGLIGLNGAGKTTLIKTLLGLRSADEGVVKIFGHENVSIKARNDIVYLPERFDPPWFLNGIEFINFSLKLYNRKASIAEIHAMADKLALDKSALKRRVQTYSKGMRQKLGLIGTILTGCNLVILDEPMSGLDPLARSLVKDLLNDIKSQDQTVLICSHILSDLDELCDRIAVLHNGGLVYEGEPNTLKKQNNSDNLERAFLQLIEQKKAA